MGDRTQDWAKKILNGDRRALARGISAVESGEPAGIELLQLLFANSGRAFVIGVTGAPGAGKSTLVEKLAREYRAKGCRVGIVAVDPTSPYSGGAILGDRIRMQELSQDADVFIRSMATRGCLGGLAPATHDVVTVLDAARFDVVLIETVGVGQDEVEVSRLADATALLLVPGMGDDVQTLKAGVMEIADFFVINKSDLPGAERVEREVASLLSLGSRSDVWTPPILRTVACTGEGIAALHQEFERFRSLGETTNLRTQRKREHWRLRLAEMLRQQLYEMAAAEAEKSGAIDRSLELVLSHRQDPHSVVQELIAGFLRASRPT